MNLAASLALNTPTPQQRFNTVCVDWDGTMVAHIPTFNRKESGQLTPYSVDFLKALLAEGFNVVILTARQDHGPVTEELQRHGFSKIRVTNIKPPAIAYIDDRAINYQDQTPVSTLLKKIEELRTKYLVQEKVADDSTVAKIA